MIIKTESSSEYDVTVYKFAGKVHLGLKRGKEFYANLTAAEAKRVAYALLMAADGIDP